MSGTAPQIVHAPRELVSWASRPAETTALGFLEAAAERIVAREPAVRAFRHVDLERATAAAANADARREAGESLGPLDGMPFAVKEIIDSAEFPTELGSPLFAGRHPQRDAEIVERLRAAGAIAVGMTTSTPFACGTTTPTANPHDLARTPGGSSAGSGAAVGAGFVPVALASQTGASTIRPASYCGAFGFKPTHGLFPMRGVHPVAASLDDVGLIAASIDDLALVAEVLLREPETGGRAAGERSGGEPAAESSARDWRASASQRPLRIGWLRLDAGAEPGPGTWAAFRELLSRLPASGPDDDAELAAFDVAVSGSTPLVFDVFAAESVPVLTPYVERADPEPDPRIRSLLEQGRAQTPEHLADVDRLRRGLRARWDALAERFDVLLTLATTGPAPLGHASTGSRTMPATASFLGIPALSLPLLEVDRLPLGLQLLGFAGHDELLFSAARALLAELENDLAPAPDPALDPAPPATRTERTDPAP